MPRTAATQDSSSLYNRQSAKLRAPNITENTPVLFRLPAVEQVLPIPVDATNDLPMPAFAESAIQATVAAPALVTPIPAAESTPAPIKAVEKQEAAATQPERSWWEHWSSGVVLILLIIALIAASILAFNDAGGTDPDLLAEASDDQTSQASISLNDIRIPSLPAFSEAASLANEEPAPKQETPVEQAGAPATTPTEAVVIEEKAPAEKALTDSVPAEAGLVLGNIELESLVNAKQSSLTQGTAPAASAIAGVELLLPALVDSEVGSAATYQSAATLQVPIGLELPSPDGDFKMPPLPGSTAGMSPTLYDDAQIHQQERTSAAVADPMTATNSQYPVDTNLPSYSVMLAGSSSASPSVTMASQQRSQSPASSPAIDVRKTATPDSSADAIIQAWQEMRTLNQAETITTNRYPSPVGTPGPSQN